MNDTRYPEKESVVPSKKSLDLQRSVNTTTAEKVGCLKTAPTAIESCLIFWTE